MSNYVPDAWVIVKLTSKGEVHHRVFAGWYGGYLGSDSWKMNSGITKVEDCGTYYRFHGESGSTYECHKEAERTTGYMAQIYANFKSQETDDLKIEMIDYKDMILC
jgi:hypothetical protein